jgi:hypothetical protein
MKHEVVLGCVFTAAALHIRLRPASTIVHPQQRGLDRVTFPVSSSFNPCLFEPYLNISTSITPTKRIIITTTTLIPRTMIKGITGSGGGKPTTMGTGKPRPVQCKCSAHNQISAFHKLQWQGKRHPRNMIIKKPNELQIRRKQSCRATRVERLLRYFVFPLSPTF